MAVEIERKFLVVSDAWRASAVSAADYRQGYLAGNADCAVRVRIGASEAWLTIKGPTRGIARAEYEYPLPLADAVEMLDTLCHAGSVEKTRHQVPHAGRTWEVDVFAGANAGLVLAEIELETADEPVDLPPWVGEEVSGDARYLNSRLAVDPFSRWGQRANQRER